MIGGSLSLGLGMLGVVLPLLPTTPFLILAAYCYARSSKRMHDWLMNHKVFGPLIDDWHQHGAIRRAAKYMATLSIAAVFLISVLLHLPKHLLLIQGATLLAVLTFIWTRPNGPAGNRVQRS